jgi:hypothetical protein
MTVQYPMDTTEARRRICDLAREGLDVLDSSSSGPVPGRGAALRIREIADQARALLTDAGYPGESVWRGLQRARVGLDAVEDLQDVAYWQDVRDELTEAVEHLDELLATRAGRDSDFRIIG